VSEASENTNNRKHESDGQGKIEERWARRNTRVIGKVLAKHGSDRQGADQEHSKREGDRQGAERGHCLEFRETI
jgi:hypothetical protein